MHLTTPPLRPPPLLEEPPAMVRTFSLEEIHWNRPVFRAPPLNVTLPQLAASEFPLIVRSEAAAFGLTA